MAILEQTENQDNILTAIQDLQRRLHELELANVTANTLDEIAPSGGALDYVESGKSTIDPNGIHTSANLVDINWWLPVSLSADVVTSIYDFDLVTFGTEKRLYVAGNFTRIGGIPAINLAYFSFTDRQWHSVGITSIDNVIYAVRAISTTKIYIGGRFTAVNGVANTNRIARFTGSSWTALGSGLNGDVYTIVSDASDDIYAGGSFTDAGGDTYADRVAKYTVGTATWSHIGRGFTNGLVKKLAFNSASVLHAVGTFDTTGYAETVSGCGRYNSVSGKWETIDALGGLPTDCNDIDFDSGDVPYVAHGVSVSAPNSTLTGWAGLGGTAGLFANTVYAIVLDKTTGNVYAAGGVLDSTLNDATRKWNGEEWVIISNGGAVNYSLGSPVLYALALDVDNLNVYAGGTFDTIGAIKCKGVAVATRQLAEAVNLFASLYELYQALADRTLITQSATLYTTTGISTAYSFATSFSGTIPYTTGERWSIKFHVTCGATPVLNRDSMGAKNLKRYDSTGAKVAVDATIILANVIYDVYYDGTDYVVLSPLIQGVNTPAQIDTHLASTANPHNTTATQVGAPDVSISTGVLADDTIYSFTPRAANGILIVMQQGTAANTEYFFGFFSTATPQITASSSGSNTVASTGALTNGTSDGTDAKLNVNAHTDGKIYLKNRMGGNRIYRIQVFTL